MIDVNKPMRIYFTRTDYSIFEAHVHGEHIFARAEGGTSWHRFTLDGKGDFPNLRLANVAPPPRKFTKVIAWVEHYGNVSPTLITERIEDCGIERYLRSYVPGKCIAFTTVNFEEGEGNPPQY